MPSLYTHTHTHTHTHAHPPISYTLTHTFFQFFSCFFFFFLFEIERPKPGQPLRFTNAYVNGAPSRTGLKTLIYRFAELIESMLGAPPLFQACLHSLTRPIKHRRQNVNPSFVFQDDGEDKDEFDRASRRLRSSHETDSCGDLNSDYNLFRILLKNAVEDHHRYTLPTSTLDVSRFHYLHDFFLVFCLSMTISALTLLFPPYFYL